jgi:hypothetical protein
VKEYVYNTARNWRACIEEDATVPNPRERSNNVATIETWDIVSASPDGRLCAHDSQDNDSQGNEGMTAKA